MHYELLLYAGNNYSIINLFVKNMVFVFKVMKYIPGE